MQRALEDEVERDRNGHRQSQRQHGDRQGRRQHARDRHHEQHDEDHEGRGLLVGADRLDQQKRPGHAEKQIEQDKA
jgi:hypothetical protein